MKTFSTVCLLWLVVLIYGCSPVSPVSNREKPESFSAELQPKDTALKNPLDEQAISSAELFQTNLAQSSAQDINTEVWDKLLESFEIDFSKHHAPVKKHIARYESNLATVNRALQQAQPYLPYVAQEIESRDLPGELALVPIIESSYNLEASNRSAVGMWQLVPATAQRFGVKQNHWYDGRRDLQASTQAALDYLSYLDELFDGDWLLVLAAYNSGEGTVQRAVRKNRAAGKPTDFWSLSLPSHTREYVPKILALSKVIAEQQKEGNFFATEETYFAPVYINSPIDLDLAAQLANISVDELYDLNPGIKQRIKTMPSSHNFLMPSDKVDAFIARLEEVPFEKRINSRWNKLTIDGIALSPTLKANSSASQKLQITGNTYKVRSGDSLWKIARQFNISPQQLAAWNNLNKNHVLRVGQMLRVKA